MASLSVDARRFEFSAGEVTGALGDSITVLPIAVAVGSLSDLSFGAILLGFAVFQVVWGLHYGVPVSVEPMKALAALVIAGGLSTGEFALAGLLAGVVLLSVGWTGTLGRIRRFVGRPVVRGVQFAVALLLLETGIGLGLENPPLALGAAALVLVVAAAGRARAAPLVVLGLGGLVVVGTGGLPSVASPSVGVGLHLPDLARLPSVVGAAAGQLAMSVGNAAVATSLLLSDYYDADVSADELASSMGVMNLAAIPLGAMPMCHGSGGVAGKYAFGARTAGANLVLGALYAVVAVFAAGLALRFPLSVLGVVLVVIAAGLARTSLDTDRLGVTLFVGAVSLIANIGVGFVAGVALYLALYGPEAKVGD